MKRLSIRVGEYEKDGETKGEWVQVGVILESENGEYALLDPTVNLAGCLMKQAVMNRGKEKKGKGDMVMCGIYTDEPKASPASAPNDFNDDIPWG